MNALFMADAHLRGHDSPAQGKVLGLLDRLQGPRNDMLGSSGDSEWPCLDMLVLAGDFFDFWFSRGDRIYPAFLPVINRLAVLKAQGVRVVLCEGNHDFHLTTYFSDRMGFEVYPEAAVLSLDGKKIFVSHGDTIDLENRKYLALRRFLRSALVLRIQQGIPLSFLWRVARFSSELSKGVSRKSQDRLADLMHRFALDRFKEGYDAVILGHCHKPGLFQEGSEGSAKIFATLGDWLVHDSYLLYQGGLFTLNRF